MLQYEHTVPRHPAGSVVVRFEDLILRRLQPIGRPPRLISSQIHRTYSPGTSVKLGMSQAQTSAGRLAYTIERSGCKTTVRRENPSGRSALSKPVPTSKASVASGNSKCNRSSSVCANGHFLHPAAVHRRCRIPCAPAVGPTTFGRVPMPSRSITLPRPPRLARLLR